MIRRSKPQVLSAGPSPEAPRRSPELALALSSGYQHDPQELLNMQQALFAGPEDEAAAVGGRRKSKSADPGALRCTIITHPL